MSTRLITTILFDLDGTLYDRDELVGALVDAQYDAFAEELSHVGRERFTARLIDLDEHGYRPKEEVYARIANDYALTPAVQSALHDHFWATYDEYCVSSADTRHTLDALRARGITLGIITNGRTIRQSAKIDALGLRHYFETISISEAEGVRKPSREIFMRTLERCGAEPSEAMHVGDHPRDDVEGALGAGLSAAWKSVSYWPLGNPAVPRLAVLSDVLKLLGD